MGTVAKVTIIKIIVIVIIIIIRSPRLKKFIDIQYNMVNNIQEYTYRLVNAGPLSFEFSFHGARSEDVGISLNLVNK